MHVARMEEGRSTFEILTGKPTGKRTLWIPILEWTLNAGNWVDSAEDRDYFRVLVNAALNLWVPYTWKLELLLIIDSGKHTQCHVY